MMIINVNINSTTGAMGPLALSIYVDMATQPYPSCVLRKAEVKITENQEILKVPGQGTCVRSIGLTYNDYSLIRNLLSIAT